ncbi:hypothetical protein K2V50_07110 [Staphylococcus epidermidis]|nr:hypothetical protein [Staphylococcus epidermidis]OFQ40756.1 hypothetical protein HMPREF2940_10060 [Staphylococcus sp. HMSC073C12]OHQ80475.1 hypothetical protein HMPREF2549_05490 [Staphylococcus sp. HMSC074D07]MCD8887075.1 hypothetical protein [Staphylococcus epidermidis]MCE5079775.1 hypothetical protein [Staphylococcus epidermidis]
MPSDYKHFEYMLSKNWIVPTIVYYNTDLNEDTPLMIPQYSDYVEATKEGEEKYYSVKDFWIKWILIFIFSFFGACATIIGILIKLL